jgi:hypothetical protein
MRTLIAAACLPVLLSGTAQAQSLSGSQIPANVPTLHQFGNALSSNGYFAGQVECGAGALTASAPIGCLNTDFMIFQSADWSLSQNFQLGGTWATGDKVGLDFWLGNGTGGYTEYPVVYTVQSSDISGAGNSLTTYQNILNRLAGTDQSGQGNGGCINGTGGYGPALGDVPSAPSNCSGTSAFLLAEEQFPDTAPVAGNGYRPQAFPSCGSTTVCYLGLDFPWGNETTGSYVSHPAVNVVLPAVTSAHGTLTQVQQSGATAQNATAASDGNTLDTGPLLWLVRGNPNGNARPDVVGDFLGRIGFLGSFDEYGSIFVVPRGLSANVASASGTTIVLTAAPVGPPDMSLSAGVSDGAMYVQDATQACALPVNTVITGWNSGSLTVSLSQSINTTAPCPGIAAGDMISFTDADNPHGGMAFAPVFPGSTFFIDEGLRTTGTSGPNNACASDPGYGNMVVCGFLHVGSLEIGGAAVSPTLAASSASIGGSSLGAGACTSGTVSVSGATTSMAVAASPATYPGDGFGWRGYVSTSGTVTVKLCNETSGSLTPTASAYNVRVLQ